MRVPLEIQASIIGIKIKYHTLTIKKRTVKHEISKVRKRHDSFEDQRTKAREYLDDVI